MPRSAQKMPSTPPERQTGHVVVRKIVEEVMEHVGGNPGMAASMLVGAALAVISGMYGGDRSAVILYFEKMVREVNTAIEAGNVELASGTRH